MSNPIHQLAIAWKNDILTVTGPALPVSSIEILYLEAFCRPASHERIWSETLIAHRTRRLSPSDPGSRLELESVLADGVVVSHAITASTDELDFRLRVENPTACASDAHWAQPCIRVGTFTGSAGSADPYDYIRKCFVFLSGELTLMPTPSWARSARYTPGQVWRPVSVPRDDVNPRPLNPLPSSNGLIGCFSQDGKMILATAWEPYQELFQGVVQCIHSDFRIGGLHPGERKTIRGKLYIVENDMDLLLQRYRKDFPEHQ